ncbi:MAG: hypothetical protein EBT59_14190 [Betaproteobacteria bacterium]|nr:hypothetical protein [Betaproteobacteria bacterium]
MLAVSLLILIAGAMLDDYLVPPVKRVHKVVEFKAERKENRTDRSESSEENSPSSEQAPQEKVPQEKTTQERAQQEKTPQERTGESAPPVATSKASATNRVVNDSGSRIQISMDANGIRLESSDPKIREGRSRTYARKFGFKVILRFGLKEIRRLSESLISLAGAKVWDGAKNPSEAYRVLSL